MRHQVCWFAKPTVPFRWAIIESNEHPFSSSESRRIPHGIDTTIIVVLSEFEGIFCPTYAQGATRLMLVVEAIESSDYCIRNPGFEFESVDDVIPVIDS
tara:strand:+ start:1360 stop:1656 length:297 start_codon:yes stop_codon:yes gene_type:complete